MKAFEFEMTPTVCKEINLIATNAEVLVKAPITLIIKIQKNVFLVFGKIESTLSRFTLY